jgi:hypothetical protein
MDTIVGLGCEVDLSCTSLSDAVERWEQPDAITRGLPTLVELCVQSALLDPRAAHLERWTKHPALSPFVPVLTTGRFDLLPSYHALRDARGLVVVSTEGKDAGATAARSSHFGPADDLLISRHHGELQAAFDAAAHHVLGDALLRSLALAAAGAPSFKKATRPKRKAPASPIVPQGVTIGGVKSSHKSLFLFLGRTLTPQEPGGWMVIPKGILNDPGTVSPLEMWALTKLASYLGLPLTEQGLGWVLA